MMSDHRIYYPQAPLIATPLIHKTAQTKSGIPLPSGSAPFGQILERQLEGVKFSQHALHRLQNRNIKLDEATMTKINSAIDKAAQKGAKESLILMNNLALVVSVKNKTVITAMDQSTMRDNVFTNIDSAVII